MTEGGHRRTERFGRLASDVGSSLIECPRFNWGGSSDAGGMAGNLF